jgi:hypothetical protein
MKGDEERIREGGCEAISRSDRGAKFLAPVRSSSSPTTLERGS